MSDDGKRLQEGSLLGPYKIVRLLGVGGMGEVFEAYDKVLNRRVALKVISASLSHDKGFVRRFMAEGQALARLNNRNVVGVYTLGEENGIHFIAMEFVDGELLYDRIKSQGVLELDEALRHFEQILAGVNALHENGIIHRDIKPKNIIISKDGSVKILDFGIAKIEGQLDEDLTSPGELVGSIYYMAPEVINRSPATVQSDIWSLGINLYEMLVGKKPFRGDSWSALADKIITEDMIFPRGKAESIPLNVQKIILKMCDKSYSRRYANVNEIKQDIETLKKTTSALRDIPNVQNLGAPPRVDNFSPATYSTSSNKYPFTGTKKEKSKLPYVIFAVLVALAGAAVKIAMQMQKPQEADVAAAPAAPVAPSVAVVSPVKPPTPTLPTYGQRIWVGENAAMRFEWSGDSSKDIVFELSKDHQFHTLIVEEPHPVSPYTTNKLADDGIYFWRLVQVVGGEKQSVFEPVSFTLITPTAPELIFPFSPLVTADGKPVKFYWQEKKGVTQYRFQMGTDSSFQHLYNDQVMKETHTASLQLPQGETFWRVRAEDSATQVSQWSEVRSMRMDPVVIVENQDKTVHKIMPPDLDPPAPVAKAAPPRRHRVVVEEAPPPPPRRHVAKVKAPVPAPPPPAPPEVKALNSPRVSKTIEQMVLHYRSNVNTRSPASLESALLNSPALSWDRTSGASAYEVQISQRSDFGQLEWANIVTETQTHWTAARPGKFFWRVRALHGSSVKGPFSSVNGLELNLPAPKLKSVFTHKLSKGSPASISWDKVPAASGYHVLVSDNKNFKPARLDVKVDRTLASVPITNGGTYYVKVAALNNSGDQAGDFSSTSELQVEDKIKIPGPNAKLPPNGVSIVSFKGSQDPIFFKWDSTNAANYRLEFSTSEKFTHIVQTEVTAKTQAVMTKPLPGGRIYWRLRAESGSTLSDWSGPYYFDLQK